MTTTARAALAAPSWRARLVGLWWDYLVIVGWLASLTVVGAIVRILVPFDAAPGPVTTGQVLLTDLAAFAMTVLPVGIYLVVTEAGSRQATWGKRRAGLRVVRLDRSRAGVGRIIVRNIVKLLPWQLAHIAVTRLILGVADQPVLTWTTYLASLVLVVVTVIIAWRDPLSRALHDRTAGTRVVAVA